MSSDDYDAVPDGREVVEVYPPGDRVLLDNGEIVRWTGTGLQVIGRREHAPALNLRDATRNHALGFSSPEVYAEMARDFRAAAENAEPWES